MKGRNIGKLFKLKEWLTVAEAAKYLAVAFSEEVTEADVLRLGLDGRLRLSIRLAGEVPVRPGTAVGEEGIEWVEMTAAQAPTVDSGPIRGGSLRGQVTPGGMVRYMKSLPIGDGQFLNFADDGVPLLNGVVGLPIPMIGNELSFVENEYQKRTGGPAEPPQCPDGAFVEWDGRICQVLEWCCTGSDAAFQVAVSMPENAVIVVRTEALREFEGAVSGAEKPLGTSERNTLLTIIAALCKSSSINYQERGAAGRIARLTAELGAPVSDDTVRRALKEIADAVESRMT